MLAKRTVHKKSLQSGGTSRCVSVLLVDRKQKVKGYIQERPSKKS